MDDLVNKKCVPCEIGGKPMPYEDAQEYLESVAGWEWLEGGKIKREFKFPDFKGAMQFVNKVAELAEKEGHHPNILIAYNKVRIVLTTYAIGGLSENDFIMAAKINRI